jgi:hypothetical protein
MKYLLDVNALIALGLEFHALHSRVALWINSEPHSSYLTTCGRSPVLKGHDFSRAASAAKSVGL